MFFEKRVLERFAKFKGNHLYEEGNRLPSVTLLKKRLWYRCFLLDFVKFSEHVFCRTHQGNWVWRWSLPIIFKHATWLFISRQIFIFLFSIGKWFVLRVLMCYFSVWYFLSAWSLLISTVSLNLISFFLFLWLKIKQNL